MFRKEDKNHFVDIDFYSDGASIEMVDCVNLPIAAASGHYNRENYFTYILKYAFLNNWIACKDINDFTFIEKANMVINEMGLCMKAKKAENTEAFLSIIQKKMREQIPVLLLVKYNAEYYNEIYHSDESYGSHMLIVDRWNENTGVYEVRNSTYGRQHKMLETKAELFFPLHYEEEQLTRLWIESCMDDEDDSAKYIYTIEKFEEKKITIFDILKQIEAFHYEKNQFTVYAEKSSYIPEEEWIHHKRGYVGTIKSIKMVLEHWDKTENIKLDSWKELLAYMEVFIKERDLAYNNLFRNWKRKKKMTEEMIQDFDEKINLMDRKFFGLVNEFCLEYQRKMDQVIRIPVPVQLYFNDEAFSTKADINCTANMKCTDVTETTGRFFLKKPDEEQISKLFSNSDKDGMPDNISCEGQEIELEPGKYGRMILLATSVYGDYTEEFQLFKNGESVGNIICSFSDYEASPKFGEETFYRGSSYWKRNGKLEKNTYSSKIFQYTLKLPEKEIDKIILPERKNIHIFSIFLEK